MRGGRFKRTTEERFFPSCLIFMICSKLTPPVCLFYLQKKYTSFDKKNFTRFCSGEKKEKKNDYFFLVLLKSFAACIRLKCVCFSRKGSIAPDLHIQSLISKYNERVEFMNYYSTLEIIILFLNDHTEIGF